MSKKVNEKVGAGKVVAGVAGVAALSAAAYMLFGPAGKKNRKKISGWAVKMKGEIIEKFEDLKEVTEPMYNKIVDEVSSKYAKAKNVSVEEVAEVVGEIKKHWKSLVKDAKGTKTSKTKKTAKKK